MEVEKYINGKKTKVEQKGVNWAIRKQMHEETVSGIVNLPWVKLGKGEITTATRERNDLVSIFKDIKTKDKAESKIGKITDTGIQKILINYLKSKENDIELAFSPEGIEDMNKNIAQFNDGKFHHPIFKVRRYEKGKGRFVLGIKGNKKSKYVQGAPNLFFGIYVDENAAMKGNETTTVIARRDGTNTIDAETTVVYNLNFKPGWNYVKTEVIGRYNLEHERGLDVSWFKKHEHTTIPNKPLEAEYFFRKNSY